MAHGMVTWFDAQRSVGGTAVVVHHTEIATAGALTSGDRVRFTLEPRSASLHAVDVHAV